MDKEVYKLIVGVALAAAIAVGIHSVVKQVSQFQEMQKQALKMLERPTPPRATNTVQPSAESGWVRVDGTPIPLSGCRLQEVQERSQAQRRC